MNERILELMTKAGFDVEKLRMYPGGWPREDLLVLQDFAELIVRECANLAKTKSNSIVDRAVKYAEDADEEISAKATAWQFLVFEQEIKKHFGIPE